MYRVSHHLDRLAASLLAGALLATLALTFAPDRYYDALEIRLLPDSAFLPLLTPQLLVTQGLMALFLFVLGKEFYESLRTEDGPFAQSRLRRLLLPALGGAIALPLLGWTLSSGLSDLAPGAGSSAALGADLALAWAFGRRVFGAGHPALGLLLVLAVALDMASATGIAAERIAAALFALLPSPEIADDANRLAGALKLLWLLPALAAPLAYRRLVARPGTERAMRRAEALGPILLTAAVTWASVLMAGLPGALALLPLIPIIPHAPRSLGLFAEAEALLHDPLNRIEALILPVLPVIAFLFGLVAGGIDLGALGPDMLRSLGAAALRGLGLALGFGLALGALGARLPPGLRRFDLGLIALLLVPGLTLPLLALDQALGGGGAAAAAKGGLALSLVAAPLALLLARIKRS